MAIVSLKSLIGKKNEPATSLLSLMDNFASDVWIEDHLGNILLGTAFMHPDQCINIYVEDELVGYVKGKRSADSIASILSLLLNKEVERKKLGAEVLNLYKEINKIF